MIWNDEIAKGAMERASGGVDMRYNDFRIGGLRVRAWVKQRSNWPGRFSGGCNWKLGFGAGGNRVSIFLLVGAITIDKVRRAA